MNDENLRALVDDFKKKGNSDESIVKLLIAVGYSEEKIRECMGRDNQAPAPSNDGEKTADPTPVPHRSGRGWPLMRGFPVLFNDAVNIYKKKVWTLTGIYIIPFLVSILAFPPLASNLSKNPSATAAAAMLAVGLVVVLLNGLAGLTIIYSLKDELNVIQSYTKAFRGIIGYYWILLLSLLIGFGGLVIGIIPAFIFSIWFAFSAYAYVFQEQRGMNALLRSKEYVTNYWWDVFWRLFLLGAIFWVANILIRLIASLSPEIGMALAYLVQLVVLPLTIVFEYLIFRNLTEVKPELAEAEVSGRRGFFVFTAWLGLLVVAVGIWAGTTFILPVLSGHTTSVPSSAPRAVGQPTSNQMDTTRMQNISVTEFFLEVYYNSKGYYPVETNWSAMQLALQAGVNSASKIITAVNPELGYCYDSLNGGKSYVMGAVLENNNSRISETLQGVRCGQYTCGVNGGNYVYCVEP